MLSIRNMWKHDRQLRLTVWFTASTRSIWVGPPHCGHSMRERWPTDAAVMAVYRSLQHHPQVRWKDSYRQVIERHTA